jgi:squalene-hopene/tetraprenyl-beta-curcumene cyclase
VRQQWLSPRYPVAERLEIAENLHHVEAVFAHGLYATSARLMTALANSRETTGLPGHGPGKGYRGAGNRLLAQAIARASDTLLGLQRDDGHWVFELEADATIPAEFVLLQHFLGEIDDSLQRPIIRYLIDIQGEDGGWPLFHGGRSDVSATVKAYFALKAMGEPLDAPHMVRAREAVRSRGGAERSNVFTRILLALFEQVPWRAVPVMPVEIMNLPRWSPFHIDKVSYWSRTVLVPLLVIMTVKPRPVNPRRIDISELFCTPPALITDWMKHGPNTQSRWASFFRGIDAVLRRVERFFPKKARARAIERAVSFVKERLNGEDGLGAIYPAMANTVMMFECLGYAKDHPDLVTAKQSLRKLLVVEQDRAYCQPCLSPIWDTALACHALLEVGGPEIDARARDGLRWLSERQVLDVVGDWAAQRPNVRPGGWPFQYANAHYPDLDDTAVVVMALDRADAAGNRVAIERATEWVEGLQSKNGGWGAFDADNTSDYLNYIPFADHGALLDPPTADVTARCVGMLAQLGRGDSDPALAAGLAFLRKSQEKDGSWFGRWGTNYIYGTWSVLSAFNAAGVEPSSPEVRRAVDWLVSVQRADGGWGESGESYHTEAPHGAGSEPTPSQTAWALLGLMAAGEVNHPAVARGIDYLISSQNHEGLWDEAAYTAVGFPRVFYLRYHGYRAFFPLWALARYRNLTQGNAATVIYGI